MEKNAEFDDIRPYYDEEVAPKMERLLNDSQFKRVVESNFPDKNWEELSALMRSFKTKREFQTMLIKNVIFYVVNQSSNSVDCTGFENIEKNTAYTFISNHRDIVLDASLLAVLLDKGGHEIPEIAIGDNLLLYPWIENLVRLNKSFIVKRGVSIRQMLEVSAHLSKYIHFAVQKKKESVWIAQREGRAKDSNDRTQESLLKMLTMGGDGDISTNIRELNIVPLSLSYEYDPCDYLKAKEFQQKRDNPGFKKTQDDDLLNMQTGILGYKGNIHFQFGRPLNSLLKTTVGELPKNELFPEIASTIDKEIFRNYRFYPVNYIAYDRLWGKNHFANQYTPGDEKAFDAYLRKQLDKIQLKNKDTPFLTEKILEMYANPVKNHYDQI
ncbi:acyltransferase [Bacteroidia bacterium]|nr:acyltransferase [Bacteroidia bacterium]